MALTITSWNVQNLDQGDPVFAEKRDFIVGTIQALGSDVVALQEILEVGAPSSIGHSPWVSSARGES